MAKQTSSSTQVLRTGPKGKMVGAVESASKILQYLRSTANPVTVTQITRELSLNSSTCFNLLATLVKEDFVQFDPYTKTYQIGFGVVALAKGALQHSTELRILRPHLEKIARRHDIMATVWRRIGEDRSMLVSTAESEAPLRIHAAIGTRGPLLLGASGRVFAAFLKLSDADMRERFDELRWIRPLSFETYRREVAETLRTGWAIDDGYYYPGTVSVSAPVYDSSATLNFCCSATMFNGQHDLKRINQIADELCAIGYVPQKENALAENNEVAPS